MVHYPQVTGSETREQVADAIELLITNSPYSEVASQLEVTSDGSGEESLRYQYQVWIATPGPSEALCAIQLFLDMLYRYLAS